MTAAPAALRARRLVIATAVAIGCGVVAIVAAIVSAAPDPAFADAVARGSAMLADRRIAVAFGPETAAAGADGGGLGWLAAVASAAFAASPLGNGAGAFVACASTLGGLALVAWRVARVASLPIAIVATALALATSIDVVHPGLAATTVVFGAALAVAFEVRGMRGVAAVGIVTLVWCQVDRAGMLAPLFAVSNVAARALARSDRATLRLALATFAVCALATLATPELQRFPALAWEALHLGGGREGVVAWTPTDVAARGYRGGFPVLLACALALGIRACGPRDAAFAIVAIVLAFANGEFVSLAAVFVTPVLAAAAQREAAARSDLEILARSDRSANPASQNVVAASVALVVALAIGLGTGLANRAIARTFEPAEPHAALAFVAAAHDVRGVACTNVASCDVAVGLRLRVLADDRVGAMPPRVRRAQLAIARASANWLREADAERIDAIVVGNRAPLATLLAAVGWHRVAPAHAIAVYVRPGHRP